MGKTPKAGQGIESRTRNRTGRNTGGMVASSRRGQVQKRLHLKGSNR